MKNVNTLAQKMSIKAASLPQRCEICHQQDCFDASANYCSRCVSYKQIPLPSTTPFSIQLPALRNFSWQNGEAHILVVMRNTLSILLILILALILYLSHLENGQLLPDRAAEGFGFCDCFGPSVGEIIGYPMLMGAIIGICIGYVKYSVSLSHKHYTTIRTVYR